MRNPDVEEYRPLSDNRLWRVGKYKEMQEFFGKMTPKDLAEFHELCQGFMDNWNIIRQAYDINPLVPRLDVDSDTMRAFDFYEICNQRKSNMEDIMAQMEYMRYEWENFVLDRPAVAEIERELDLAPRPAAPVTVVSGPVADEVITAAKSVITDAKETITMFGFTLKIFEGIERSDDVQMLDEMTWFAGRLKDLSRAFEETNAKGLVRQALLNELQMRRVDDELCITPVRSKSFSDLQKSKQTIESIYAKQWTQLEELCPYLKALKNKTTVSGVLSEFVEAIKHYMMDRNNDIIDGLFTSLEIQVEMRSSEQLTVRYRPEVVCAVNEAKKHLWNPHFKTKLTPQMNHAMRQGWMAAFQVVRENTGRQIDLVSDSPQAEYEKFHIAPLDEPDTEVLPPESCVPLADTPVRH